MHNCSHCQIRLSNHLFRLLSSFILCGFVFQGCLGHFLEVPGAYETYILAYILALRVRPGPTRWKCWKTSIILLSTKSLSSKKIRSWQVCPGQVVAGRMGLLITILLCLVNIFNVINNNSPSVKVADTSNWFHIHLSRLGALSCY